MPIAVSLATFATLGFVVVAGNWLRGVRVATLGLPALAGIGMYLASVALMQSYHLFTASETQVLVYQYSLLGIVPLYLVAGLVVKANSRIIVLAVLAAALFLANKIGEPTMEEGKLLEAGFLLIITLMALECLAGKPRRDALAFLMWAPLAISEGATFALHLSCQFGDNFNLAREAGSACQKLYGPYVPYIPIAGPGVAIVYALHRFLSHKP